MAALDEARLVLILSAASNASAGVAPGVDRVGTGYFVTPNLVLTASHVVPSGYDSIAVRVEAGAPRWRRGGRVVWRDEKLDAALIYVDEPLPATLAPVTWAEAVPSTT